MRQFTAEMRSSLRELLAGDQWEPVKVIIEALTENAARACETVPQDHRFYQGQAFAYRNLAVKLQEMSNPVALSPASHTPTEHFAPKSGRNADFGY